MRDRFTGLPAQTPSGAAPDLSRSLGGGLRPGRVMLLGCGALVVLLGVAALVFLLKADDFVGWVFGSIEETVLERLPPDLPNAERQRLEAAFDGAIGRMAAGGGDPQALRRLQAELSAIVRGGDDRPLTREEIAEITAALEAVAAGESDAP